MRHLAWLQAVPRPPRGTKRAEKFNVTSAKSRIDRMKSDGIVPAMPPNSAPHIVNRLVEMGMSEAAGMGAAPISWQTIDAFQRVTGVTLSPWEARLIRRLSVDYLAESRRAEDENSPPPWAAPTTRREIETEQSRLEMVLG